MTSYPFASQDGIEWTLSHYKRIAFFHVDEFQFLFNHTQDVKNIFNSVGDVSRLFYDNKCAIFYFSGKGPKAARIGLESSPEFSPVKYKRLFLSLLDKDNTDKLAQDVAMKENNIELTKGTICLFCFFIFILQKILMKFTNYHWVYRVILSL